jgi:nitric oxide reductase NorD protein
MYRNIPAKDPNLQRVVTETPLDDYELIDFGRGRKLERFGPFIVKRPDPHAQGEPRLATWNADWVYTGAHTGWQRARNDLPTSWTMNLDGMTVRCEPGEGGCLGLQPRDVACRRWIRDCLAGCYDIEDPHVLNLFAGSGMATHAALAAGASVVHVDASSSVLALAQRNAGLAGIRYECAHVPAYIERARRLGERYHFIVISPPRIGHAPGGASWDIEVDLARLVRNLPHVASRDCRGIWVTVDGGSWSPSSVAQMLREALPGRTLHVMSVGVATAEGRVLPAGGAAGWVDEHDFLHGDGPLPSMSGAQIEEYLDAYLDAVLSSRRTASAPARSLAALAREQQEFVLHWTRVTAHTNAEVAYQFASYAADAFGLMEASGVEAWLIHSMDIYDTTGLHAGISSLGSVQAFAEQHRGRMSGLAFEDVAGVLEAFVHGLSGRRLKLETAGECYTDTETIFLPGTVARFSDRDENFQLYKAIAVHLWAQTWYGTWRVDPGAVAAQYPNPERALRLFHALEAVRLDACIERDLPGLHRALRTLKSGAGSAWAEAAAHLRVKGATVEDTCTSLAGVYELEVPPAHPYQGTLLPGRVAQVRAARLARDRHSFRVGLTRMQHQAETGPSRDEGDEADGHEPEPTGKDRRVTLRQVPAADLPDGFTFEIELNGRPVAPPDVVRGTMASILQDLGEIPEEYLFAAGDGAYAADARGAATHRPEDVWKGTYHEEGAHIYNEWDYERQHYRKNWAVLRELDVHPRYDDFVSRTLLKHRGLVGTLRRSFEALRGEDRLLKRQPYGDDVDIDALVHAYADAVKGAEVSDRLFVKRHKLERNIAVMFMVDMSGSTKGWINEAEREALLLLCEALETLGDRYAIYGFSGMTRKRCEVYRIKQFTDPYDELVRARISGIKPRDYTRMGVTIRHLTQLLTAVEARTKLLITLSDGKPDDYDGYRGAYGIEDTRQALIEARRDGVHCFCITIDTEARDYLPHMYGAVNYAVVDEVRKLPLKVSDIYRRLTS